MGNSQERKNIPKGLGFVPLLLDIINSIAYISMSHSARGLLPYLMAKVKLAITHPERHEFEFSFSYSEGRKYRFSNDTIEKSLYQLIHRGFIDPVSLGGMRGLGKTTSTFKLSERWKHYGTSNHKPIDWKKWKADYELGQNS